MTLATPSYRRIGLAPALLAPLSAIMEGDKNLELCARNVRLFRTHPRALHVHTPQIAAGTPDYAVAWLLLAHYLCEPVSHRFKVLLATTATQSATVSARNALGRTSPPLSALSRSTSATALLATIGTYHAWTTRAV